MEQSFLAQLGAVNKTYGSRYTPRAQLVFTLAPIGSGVAGALGASIWYLRNGEDFQGSQVPDTTV